VFVAVERTLKRRLGLPAPVGKRSGLSFGELLVRRSSRLMFRVLFSVVLDESAELVQARHCGDYTEGEQQPCRSVTPVRLEVPWRPEDQEPDQESGGKTADGDGQETSSLNQEASDPSFTRSTL